MDGLKRFFVAILMACLAMVALGTPSQAMADTPAAETEQTPRAEEGPVAVPEPSEKAWRYYHSGNVLWLVQRLWGLLIPALILFTGLSAKLRDAAQKIAGRWWLVVISYFVLYTLLTFVIDLPLSYYASYVRPHSYGLSDQAFSKWVSDTATALALGLGVGSALIWIPYLLLRKSPERWWIYTSLIAVPIAVFMMMVAPVFVSPLFNDFGPMQDKALEAQILALAERAGIEGGRVFEVNKSVDTNTVNAYVAGLGGTKRIVLWDTIIERLDRRELLFVMGHEMGHYVLGHIRNGIMLMIVGIPLTLYVAHRLSKWVIARWKHRLGFDRLSDPASLPLIVLIASLFGLIVTPLAFMLTRHQEHESDRFGLEITHDNYGCASAFAKLAEENLGIPRPGPLYELWRATHPVLGDRIDFCNEYRPWEQGDPGAYSDLFTSPPE